MADNLSAVCHLFEGHLLLSTTVSVSGVSPESLIQEVGKERFPRGYGTQCLYWMLLLFASDHFITTNSVRCI